MPELEVIGPNRYRIRNGPGPLRPLLGIPFAALGVMVGVWPLLSNLYDWLGSRLTSAQVLECVPGMFLGMLVGLPMLAAGWALAVLRHRLSLDLVEGAVTETRDLYVWRWERQCSLADVQHIEVAWRTGGNTTASSFLDAALVTRRGKYLVTTQPAPQEGEVRELARQLSTLLDRPLVELSPQPGE